MEATCPRHKQQKLTGGFRGVGSLCSKLTPFSYRSGGDERRPCPVPGDYPAAPSSPGTGAFLLGRQGFSPDYVVCKVAAGALRFAHVQRFRGRVAALRKRTLSSRHRQNKPRGTQVDRICPRGIV